MKWTGTATGHLAVLLEAHIEAFLCLGPYLVGTNADNPRCRSAIVSFAPNPLLFPSFLQISLVSQEPVLFARSIADNISYGLASASFESVVQAAQKANAHAFITELQDGYHTGTNIPLFALREPWEGRGCSFSLLLQLCCLQSLSYSNTAM